MTSRERFEKWMKDQYPSFGPNSFHFLNDHYVEWSVDMRWQAWQAADSLPNSTPALYWSDMLEALGEPDAWLAYYETGEPRLQPKCPDDAQAVVALYTEPHIEIAIGKALRHE